VLPADGSEIETDIISAPTAFIVIKEPVGADARFAGCIFGVAWRQQRGAATWPLEAPCGWARGHVVFPYDAANSSTSSLISTSDSWTGRSWTRGATYRVTATAPAGILTYCASTLTARIKQMGAPRSRSAGRRSKKAGNAVAIPRTRCCLILGRGGDGDRGRLRALSRDRAPRR
jgi:hypothetical protein